MARKYDIITRTLTITEVMCYVTNIAERKKEYIKIKLIGNRERLPLKRLRELCQQEIGKDYIVTRCEGAEVKWETVGMTLGDFYKNSKPVVIGENPADRRLKDGD